MFDEFDMFDEFFFLLDRFGLLTGWGIAFPDYIAVGDGIFDKRLGFVQVVGADAADCVLVVAVHVHEGFEAVFFAAVEKPIDGALLIDFDVIGVEVFQKVVADDFARGIAFVAEGLGGEVEVFF